MEKLNKTSAPRFMAFLAVLLVTVFVSVSAFADSMTGRASASGSTLTPPIQVKAQSVISVDQPSTALTASSGYIVPPVLDGGNSLAAVVNVSAVSGTSPALDMALQESQDGGVTWEDIFHLPRITTTGPVIVRNMLMTGMRRWRYTILGTSPSFTLSVTVTRGTAPAPLIRQFFDRTINANTNNSTTPTWSVAGCRNNQYFVFNGAVVTTAAQFQVQFSPDGSNFTNAGSPMTPGNNGTAQNSTTSSWPFVRVGVTSAGVGDTINYVSFYCTN